MDEKITIIVRDINGKRDTIDFPTRSLLLRWAEDEMDEDDEILVVAQYGLCLYSALQSPDQPSLTCDDLTGFFG